MKVKHDRTMFPPAWNTTNVLTLVSGGDQVAHRVVVTDASGFSAALELTADKANDLYLKLKASIET